MDERLKELFESLKTRKDAGRWGIGTAHSYVSAMIGCLNGGACDAEYFGVRGKSLWDELLRKSAEQLTYCDPALEIKSIDEGTELPKGVRMIFDAVITTTRKDRDGDILRTGGAKVDPNMALLWQHMAPQPIGKFLGVTEHTKELLAGRHAIADIALGRDAAVLVEMNSRCESATDSSRSNTSP